MALPTAELRLMSLRRFATFSDTFTATVYCFAGVVVLRQHRGLEDGAVRVLMIFVRIASKLAASDSPASAVVELHGLELRVAAGPWPTSAGGLAGGAGWLAARLLHLGCRGSANATASRAEMNHRITCIA
ncbi:hypothetical protein [Piscinibacter sp.]|uniref:hypothetical protein n=1 Tax=Piscinibacter sp. TaxID=1903157 RepID=UPI0025FA849C|nr:hypothetical protein [Piscinibacter sp.]